ncbi:MAG: hypothetical protein Q9179_007624, partial [Wetmoreana sp. 5 TL-2023]
MVGSSDILSGSQILAPNVTEIIQILAGLVGARVVANPGSQNLNSSSLSLNARRPTAVTPKRPSRPVYGAYPRETPTCLDPATKSMTASGHGKPALSGKEHRQLHADGITLHPYSRKI